MTANGSGQVYWTYPTTCSDPVGTYSTWIVDTTANWTSTHVSNVVTASASCAPKTFTVSPSSGQQGTAFTWTGTGLTPGDSVQQWWRSEEHTSELQSLRHLVC